MVCATALLSASLAVSLLRNSAPPDKSFVMSPFSLDTALSVVNDGAEGCTQKELTDFLLHGCTPADVTAHYSSLALALTANNVSGVTFKSANRFYVDESTSLKPAYEAQVAAKYKVQVEKVDFAQKSAIVNEVNGFVNGATEGMIRKMIDEQMITDDMVAMFVNAIYFLGKWKYTLKKPYNDTFHGLAGDRKMEFMSQKENYRVNFNSKFGTALVLPYKDESYSFFFLMPTGKAALASTLKSLNGKGLLDTLKAATQTNIEIIIPKFKVDSKLDAVKVLQKMGVHLLFADSADLSKSILQSVPYMLLLFVYFEVTSRIVRHISSDHTRLARMFRNGWVAIEL